MHQINKWTRKDGWVTLRWQARGDSLNNSHVAVPGTMFAEAGSQATVRTCSKNEHWEEMKETENSNLPCHPTTAVSALFQHSYFYSVHWEQTACTSIFWAVFWGYNSIWHYLSENSALKQAPAFFPHPLGKQEKKKKRNMKKREVGFDCIFSSQLFKKYIAALSVILLNSCFKVYIQ